MSSRRILSGPAADLLVGLVGVVVLYVCSLHSYLLFHSLVEMFTIVVAGGIFMVAWNGRDFLDNHYLLLVAIAYLFAAIIDLLHTLAYKGMGVFPGTGANLATQLWVMARWLQAVSLLVAPLFLTRRLNQAVAILCFAAITTLLLSSVFVWHIFPDSYVDGVGLTPFKRVSEYAISTLFLVSLVLLLRRRASFDPAVLRLVVASLGLTILSEIAFTEYVSVYGPANLIGHLIRLIAFLLMYMGIIETGLRKPYRLLLHSLKQNQDALSRYACELEARNEELDAFAHTVAHDLKNPLSVVYTACSTMHDPDVPPEDRQMLVDLIERAAHKMRNIVDELLLLAQVRQAEVPLKRVEMADVVEQAVARTAHLIREYDADVRLPREWPAALGYAPWVEEVWTNYLSNAVQYGGRPPRLEAGATRLDDGRVRFWVRDNGAGLSCEEQTRLFTPFTRLSQTHTLGHGLGLSIVRRIVEKLDGQVGVESEPGRGSVFYFTLPAAPAPEPVTPTISARSPAVPTAAH